MRSHCLHGILLVETSALLGGFVPFLHDWMTTQYCLCLELIKDVLKLSIIITMCTFGERMQALYSYKLSLRSLIGSHCSCLAVPFAAK